MWTAIGIRDIGPAMIDELRAQAPLLASSKVGLPGFVHGTWTRRVRAEIVTGLTNEVAAVHLDMLLSAFWSP